MKYVCTAIKEREPFVDYLSSHIPSLNVVWDKERNPMETFTRAWREFPETSLRFQDDIILTKDFLSKAHAIIEQYPHDVIQFFSMRKADIEKGTRWENGSNWLMNQCHYLPDRVAGELAEYALTWEGMSEHPTADDLLMRDYFKKQKRKYLVVVPSLVDHASVYSVINRKRSKFRQSLTFKEPELKNFPTIKDYEV